MRKIRYAGLIVLLLVFLLCIKPMSVYADQEAVFHVQTAYIQDDGTIKVSVYLTDTSILGGVDAELIYDPDKVDYVSSELGDSFNSDYFDVYHNEEDRKIKYVVLYPEEKEAHGALIQAVFKLKKGESYQPELKVVDLVDNTDEIQNIPYTITYQQADGSWKDSQDTSGKKADMSVIEEAVKEYGSAEDQKEIFEKRDAANENESNMSKQPDESDSAGNDRDGEKISDDESDKLQNNEESRSEQSKFDQNSMGSKVALRKNVWLAVAGIIVLAAIIMIVSCIKRKKGKNSV